MSTKNMSTDLGIHKHEQESNLRHCDLLDKALKDRSIIKHDKVLGQYYVQDKEGDSKIFLYHNSDMKRAIYETKVNYIIKGINTILNDVLDYNYGRKYDGIMEIFNAYEYKFPKETEGILTAYVKKDLKAVESERLLIKIRDDKLIGHLKSNMRGDAESFYPGILARAINNNSRSSLSRRY